MWQAPTESGGDALGPGHIGSETGVRIRQAPSIIAMRPAAPTRQRMDPSAFDLVQHWQRSVTATGAGAALYEA
jgi:hypothetical protein